MRRTVATEPPHTRPQLDETHRKPVSVCSVYVFVGTHYLKMVVFQEHAPCTMYMSIDEVSSVFIYTHVHVLTIAVIKGL